MSAAFTRVLVETAAAPYRSGGRFAWHFARGKLRRDPAFLEFLERGLIPDHARILDLGCGQGLLGAWLFAARTLYEAGRWPVAWPVAPRPSAYRGIELMPRDVRRARGALGDRAECVLGDIRTTAFGKPDTIVILDVLHYLEYAAQDEVLIRARDALLPAGWLLMRVGDAEGGLSFRISKTVDFLVTLAKGHHLSRLYCRTLRDWQDALCRLGFTVRPIPMSRGTPFANVLLVAWLDQHSRDQRLYPVAPGLT